MWDQILAVAQETRRRADRFQSTAWGAMIGGLTAVLVEGLNWGRTESDRWTARIDADEARIAKLEVRVAALPAPVPPPPVPLPPVVVTTTPTITTISPNTAITLDNTVVNTASRIRFKVTGLVTQAGQQTLATLNFGGLYIKPPIVLLQRVGPQTNAAIELTPDFSQLGGVDLVTPAGTVLGSVQTWDAIMVPAP